MLAVVVDSISPKLAKELVRTGMFEIKRALCSMVDALGTVDYV